MEKPTGERLAVLEDWRREGADPEIRRIRAVLHDYATLLQKLQITNDSHTVSIDAFEEDVVPEIRMTLKEQAEAIRQIREKTLTHGTDYVWLKKTLLWVLSNCITLALFLAAQHWPH